MHYLPYSFVFLCSNVIEYKWQRPMNERHQSVPVHTILVQFSKHFNSQQELLPSTSMQLKKLYLLVNDDYCHRLNSQIKQWHSGIRTIIIIYYILDLSHRLLFESDQHVQWIGTTMMLLIPFVDICRFLKFTNNIQAKNNPPFQKGSAEQHSNISIRLFSINFLYK